MSSPETTDTIEGVRAISLGSFVAVMTTVSCGEGIGEANAGVATRSSSVASHVDVRTISVNPFLRVRIARLALATLE